MKQKQNIGFPAYFMHKNIFAGLSISLRGCLKMLWRICIGRIRQYSCQFQTIIGGEEQFKELKEALGGQKGPLFPLLSTLVFPPFPLIFIAIFLSFFSPGWEARRRWDEIDKGWPLSHRRPSEEKKRKFLTRQKRKRKRKEERLLKNEKAKGERDSTSPFVSREKVWA